MIIGAWCWNKARKIKWNRHCKVSNEGKLSSLLCRLCWKKFFLYSSRLHALKDQMQNNNNNQVLVSSVFLFCRFALLQKLIFILEFWTTAAALRRLKIAFCSLMVYSIITDACVFIYDLFPIFVILSFWIIFYKSRLKLSIEAICNEEQSVAFQKVGSSLSRTNRHAERWSPVNQERVIRAPRWKGFLVRHSYMHDKINWTSFFTEEGSTLQLNLRVLKICRWITIHVVSSNGVIQRSDTSHWSSYQDGFKCFDQLRHRDQTQEW